MTLHHETVDQKLAVVEKLIPLYRAIGRAQGDDGTYEALKAIAAELRARRDLQPSNVRADLLRAMGRVETLRDALSYDVDSLIQLSQVLNNRWPLVSQALERFEAVLDGRELTNEGEQTR